MVFFHGLSGGLWFMSEFVMWETLSLAKKKAAYPLISLHGPAPREEDFPY